MASRVLRPHARHKFDKLSRNDTFGPPDFSNASLRDQEVKGTITRLPPCREPTRLSSRAFCVAGVPRR